MKKVTGIESGRGFSRAKEPGADTQPREAAPDSGVSDLETRVRMAKGILEQIVADSKPRNTEAEGQLLLLNKVGDLQSIIEFLQSLQGPPPSPDARAADAKIWHDYDDHQLIQAIQIALTDGRVEWDTYPARYFELVREYQRRVIKIVDTYSRQE